MPGAPAFVEPADGGLPAEHETSSWSVSIGGTSVCPGPPDHP